MHIEIRKCTYDDIPVLVAISTQSYREHYTYLWHDAGEGYIKSNFNDEQLTKEISDDNSVFFLLLSEQRPVGILKLNIDKAIGGYTSNQSLELERIYFIKEASGRGLGKAALEFVIDFAKHRNKRQVWLKTMDNSKALDFYKKQGFIAISETYLDYPHIKHEYRIMIILAREI